MNIVSFFRAGGTDSDAFFILYDQRDIKIDRYVWVMGCLPNGGSHSLLLEGAVCSGHS